MPLDQIRNYTAYESEKKNVQVKGKRQRAKKEKPVEKVTKKVKEAEAEEDEKIEWPLVVHPK